MWKMRGMHLVAHPTTLAVALLGANSFREENCELRSWEEKLHPGG